MRGFAGDQVAVWKHMDWSATRVTLCAETHSASLAPWLAASLPLCLSSDPPSATSSIRWMPSHNFTLSGVTFGGMLDICMWLQLQTLLLRIWAPFMTECQTANGAYFWSKTHYKAPLASSVIRRFQRAQKTLFYVFMFFSFEPSTESPWLITW